MVEKSWRDWNRGDEWKREGDKGRGTKWEDERQNGEIRGNREEQSTNYRFMGSTFSRAHTYFMPH